MLAKRVSPFTNFDRLINDLTTDQSTKEYDFRPNVNITESEDNLRIFMELPGVVKENVKVTVNDENVMTIKGERTFDSDNNGKVYREEMMTGRFNRSFIIPKEFDSEKIDAKFKNGILNLSIERKESVKPKQISIK